MKRLSLDEIDKYIELAERIGEYVTPDAWDFAEGDDSIVKSKLSFIMAVKILKEVGSIPKKYSCEMAEFTKMDIVNETICDGLYDIGYMFEDLLEKVYKAMGWKVKNYNLECFFSDICSSHGIEFDDLVESFHSMMKDEELQWDFVLPNEELKKFLGNDYKVCKNSVVSSWKHAYESQIVVTGMCVARNFRLGKYLSYVKSHPEIEKTEVGHRIKDILDKSISPMQIWLPGITLENQVYDKDFIINYNYFHTVYSTENGDSHHLQMDRVIYLVMINALLDIAYAELINKEAA